MEREELIKLIMKRIYTRRIYAEGLADDILRLFSVSCQCDACKQDRIDSDYRKYLELNKNVKGYD